MAKINILKDILTEIDSSGKKIYSQGRIYLFISVLAYFVVLGIVSYKAFTHKDIDDDNLKTVIDGLQWCILMFGTYSFGSKGVDAAKNIFSKKDAVSAEPVQNQNPTPEEENKV